MQKKARYNLDVLKVPLNPNQSINNPLPKSDFIFISFYQP